MITTYWALVFWCLLQRLVELVHSRRNQQALAKMGFVFQETPKLFQRMVLVHALWFVGLLVEPLVAPRVLPVWVAICGAILFLLGQFLRFWVLSSLGKHWNVTVMRPVGEGAFVSSGPYRFVRHPNYLAIILEFISLPLVGGAVVTGVVGSLLNAYVLRGRIREEDAVLLRDARYSAEMGSRSALIPGIY